MSPYWFSPYWICGTGGIFTRQFIILFVNIVYDFFSSWMSSTPITSWNIFYYPRCSIEWQSSLTTSYCSINLWDLLALLYQWLIHHWWNKEFCELKQIRCCESPRLDAGVSFRCDLIWFFTFVTIKDKENNIIYIVTVNLWGKRIEEYRNRPIVRWLIIIFL